MICIKYTPALKHEIDKNNLQMPILVLMTLGLNHRLPPLERGRPLGRLRALVLPALIKDSIMPYYWHGNKQFGEFVASSSK